jgi:predicted CoA-substrate-specific enzyme activase
MHFGIDLGSRAVKIVGYADGGIGHKTCYDTARFYREFGRMAGGELAVSFESLGLAPSHGRLTVTGYGRNAVRVKGATVISEVKAHTIGAVYQTRLMDFTLLDIGGQDTKVIMVKGGRMEDFVMNDKCAASSGRYIENMAAVLNMTLDEISRHSDDPASLSSTCAIFGESEIIQKMAEGVPGRELAAGVNLTIARRVLPMLGRFPAGPIVFSGGVARNAAVVSLVRTLTRREVIVLPEPSFNGALGCALP